MSAGRTIGAALALLMASVLAPAYGADAGGDQAKPAAAPAAPASAQAAVNAGSPKAPLVSIMFTPDEVAAIGKAIDARLHPPAAEVAARANKSAAAVAMVAAEAEAARPHVPNIYVSAVVDFGGGDWTVWANGLKFTPDRQSPLFQIKSVSGNSVDIAVPSESVRVRLQPNQTWRSRENDVVEGIVP